MSKLNSLSAYMGGPFLFTQYPTFRIINYDNCIAGGHPQHLLFGWGLGIRVFNDCIRRAKTLLIKQKFEAIAMILNIPSWLSFFTPPSSFLLVPTGIKDLMLYPLGPTAVVLSWTRPYLGVFRKYVVEMFYFNPATMTSEWTTYYEIAATASLTASVVILGI